MGKIRQNTCSLAIIKTLSYSGVFGYPLTFYQLTTNLITHHKFTPKKVRKELNRLVKSKVVRKAKGKYILKGLRGHDSEKRAKNSTEIIKKNKSAIKMLSKIPWIKMIAVTGSVANMDATEKDDIDLLFITEKNRLWICRGFVFLILKVLGKLPKDKTKREICPNIFIDERNLSWAKKRRNLYVAQNIISMQPLIWRDNIYFEFVKANKWIFKYYRNFKVKFPNKKRQVKNITNLVMSFIENLARKSQISYMRDFITTEIASDKLIHFNKNDSSKKILSDYKSILKKVKKS
jgi:hypothetical protein